MLVAFILPLLTIYLGHCFSEKLYFSIQDVAQFVKLARRLRFIGFIGFMG